MNISTSFKGKSIHTINGSGRISIPSRFREVLKSKYGDEELILVPLGSHIVAYPIQEWLKLEKIWELNPPKDTNGKKFLRYLYSTAEEVLIDKLGRILIPPLLRQSINLQDECVVTGQMNKIELWPKEKWEEEYKEINVRGIFETVSSQFPELNL